MAENEENTPVTPASSIPKRTIRLKPIQPVQPVQMKAPSESGPALEAPSVPVSAPSSAIPGSKHTIRLRPSMSSITPHPVGEPAAQTPPPSSGDDTNTIKISVQQQTAAPVGTDTSRLSRRTIKLVPRTVTPAHAPAPSSPTIQLGKTPSPSSQTIQMGAAPSPSSPTIQLGKTPSPSSPTIQLGRTPSPSSPTIQLSGAQHGPISSTPTIQLNNNTSGIRIRKLGTQSSISAVRPPEGVPPAGVPRPVKNPVMNAEPHPAFFVTAVISFLLIGFLALIVFAQYFNFYQGKAIDIPGMKRLSGHDPTVLAAPGK